MNDADVIRFQLSVDNGPSLTRELRLGECRRLCPLETYLFELAAVRFEHKGWSDEDPIVGLEFTHCFLELQEALAGELRDGGRGNNGKGTP